MNTEPLKTPISYYGGKQKLAKKVVSFFPEHKLYGEPFFGGGAVFFEKPQSEIEVINDTNQELINFYKVLKNRYHDLSSLVKTTLHSRRLHRDAQIIYEAPHLFDEVRRAWAVWVLSTQSFCAQLDGSFGYDKSRQTTTKKIINKRDGFVDDYAIRLQNVQIECADALYIIKSRDTKESFFYCDPPYFNSNCGHYDGYSEQDFENLLELLVSIKGRFLMSSYPSTILQKFAKANKWHMWSIEQGVSVNARGGYLKRKIEVLTANYPLISK